MKSEKHITFKSNKTSIILPAYNEKGRIAVAIQTLLKKLENLKDYEIIIVDDGSTDGTKEEALRIADGKRVKVFSYNNNVGKGFAIKYGVKKASGENIIFLDSDLEVKADGLTKFIEALRLYDLVIASKRHPESKVEAPLARKLLSYSFHTLVKLLTGIKVSDTQSGLKAGRSQALKRIFGLMSVKRYAFDVEMLTIAKLLNYKIKELPVEIKLKGMFSLREVIRMLIDLLGIAYRLRVKRWYQANLNKEKAEYKPIIKW